MTDHSVPPTHADMLDDDISPRPAWPKVIGIISIVFGALGLVCSIVGVGSVLFLPSMMANQPFEGGTPPVFPYVPASPFMTGLMILGTLWAIVLIVAGAMLVARKPVARPLMIVYAIVATLLGAVTMKLQVDQQNMLMDWMRENPNAQVTQMSGGNVGGLIGLAVGGFFAFAWPLFILFWFLVVKRRNADIAEGVEAIVA